MDVADDSHAALVLHELWYHVCHDVGDGDDDPQPPAAAATAAMATPSTTPEFHSEAAKGHEEGNSTSGYIQLPAEMEKMTSPEVRDKMTSPEVRDKMTSPEVQGAFTQDSNSPLGRTIQLEKEEEESVSTLPPVEVLPAFQLNSSDAGTNRDGGLLHLTNILTLLEQLEEVRRRNAALERRCAFLHQLQSLVTYQNSVLQAENWKRSRRRKQQQRHGAKGGVGFHGGGSTWSDGNHLSPGRGGGVEFFARNPSRSTDNDVTGTERMTSPPPLNFSEKSMKWERKKSKKLQAKWEQVKKVFTSGGGGGGGKPEVASNRPETGSSTPKSREKPRNRKSKKRFATIVALNKDTLEAIRSTLASEGGRREGQREGQPDEEEPSSPSSVKSEPAGIEPGDDDEEATERCVWSFVAHLDDDRSPAPKQVTLHRSHSSQSKITETDSKVETKVETGGGGGGAGVGGGGRGIIRSRSFMTSRDTATDVTDGLLDAAPVESSKSVPSSPVQPKTTQDLDPKQEEERIVTSSAQVQSSSYGAEAGKRAKAAWDKVKDMIQTRRDSFRLKGQQRRSSVGNDGDDGQKKPEERHKNSLGHVDAGGGGANDVIDGDNNCASSAEVVVEGNDVRGGHVTVAPQKSSGSDEGSSASSPTRCTGSLAKSTVTSQTVAKERHDVTGAAKTPTTENDKSTKDEETTAKRSNQREKSIGAGKKKTTKNIGRAKSVDTSIVKFSEDFISKMEQWEEKQKLAAHPVRVKRNSESMDCPLDPTTAAEPKEQLSESFMKTLENWAKVRGGRAKSREGRSRDTEQSRSRERAKSAQRVEKALQKIGKKEQKLGTELQKLADMKQKLETSVRENTHQGQGPDKVKAAAKVKESGDKDVNTEGVVGIVENAEEPEKMENHEVCKVSNEFKDIERIEMFQKRKHSIQDKVEDHKNSAAIPSGDERQNHGAVDGRFNRRSVSDPGEIRNKSSEEERENDAPSATTSDKNAALSCDNFSSVKTKLEFDDVTFETEESANDVGLQTNDVTGVEFEDGESVKRKKVEDTVKKLEEELRTKNELMTSLDRKFEELQTKILQLHLDKGREEEEEAKELDSIKMQNGKSIPSSFAFKDTGKRQESTDQKDQDSSYSTNVAYGTSTPSPISTSTNAIKTSTVYTDVISTITIGAHALDVNSLKNNDDNSKIISGSNPTGTSTIRHSITGTGTGTRADRALAVPDSCLHFGQRGNGVPGTPGATGAPGESITVTCYRTLSLSSFRSSGKARSCAEDDGTSSSAFHSIGEPIRTKEPTHVTPPSVTSFGVADCVTVKSKPVAVGDVRGHETRQDAETEEEAVNPDARDAGATGDPGRVSSDVDAAPRNVSGRFVRVSPRDVIVSASDLSTQRQWRHQRRHSDDKKSFTDDVMTDGNEDSVTTVGVPANNSHLFSSRGSPLYRTLPSYHHARRPPEQEGPTSGHRAGHFRLSRDPPFVRASGPPLIVVRSLKTAAELMAEVRRPRGKMTSSSKRPASENFTRRQRRTQRHEDSPATVEDHRHHALTPPTPPPPPQPSLHPPETTSDTLPTDPKTPSPPAVNHRKTDSTDDADASNPVFETPTRGHSTTGKLSSNPSTPHSPNTTSASPTRSTTGHRKSKPPPSKWETTFLEMGPDHPTSDSTSKTVTGRSQTVSFDLGECPQQTPKQPPRAAAGNGSREGQPGETLGPPTGVKQGPDPQPPQKTKRNLIDIGWLNKSKKFFKTSKQW